MFSFSTTWRRLQQGLCCACILACILSPSSRAETSADTASDETALLKELVAQIRRVQAEPDSVQLYKPLYEQAAKLSDKPLREPLCFLIALGMLNCGKTDVYKKQRQTLKSLFPESQLHARIAPEAFLKPCPQCDGSGKGSVPCAPCAGEGRCPNAKCIEGSITYRGTAGNITKPCPVCRGAKACLDCEGTGERRGTTCRACDGRRGTASRKLLQDQLLSIAATTLATVKSRVKVVEPEAYTAGIRDTGNAITPPHLQERLKAFGQWMLMQQRRLDMKIVSKVYAKIEDGRAVLYLIVTPNFTDQDYDWRLTMAKACFRDWHTKCTGAKTSRYYPGMLMLDAEDTKVGEYLPAEGRILLPK